MTTQFDVHVGDRSRRRGGPAEDGLGLHDVVHRRVGDAGGRAADHVAVEDEDHLVGTPFHHGRVPPGGEKRPRDVGVLVRARRAVLTVHEGADLTVEIALGEVDLTVARGHVAVGPEQPGHLVSGRRIGLEPHGVAPVPEASVDRPGTGQERDRGRHLGHPALVAHPQPQHRVRDRVDLGGDVLAVARGVGVPLGVAVPLVAHGGGQAGAAPRVAVAPRPATLADVGGEVVGEDLAPPRGLLPRRDRHPGRAGLARGRRGGRRRGRRGGPGGRGGCRTPERAGRADRAPHVAPDARGAERSPVHPHLVDDAPERCQRPHGAADAHRPGGVGDLASDHGGPGDPPVLQEPQHGSVVRQGEMGPPPAAHRRAAAQHDPPAAHAGLGGGGATRQRQADDRARPRADLRQHGAPAARGRRAHPGLEGDPALHGDGRSRAHRQVGLRTPEGEPGAEPALHCAHRAGGRRGATTRAVAQALAAVGEAERGGQTPSTGGRGGAVGRRRTEGQDHDRRRDGDQAEGVSHALHRRDGHISRVGRATEGRASVVRPVRRARTIRRDGMLMARIRRVNRPDARNTRYPGTVSSRSSARSRST